MHVSTTNAIARTLSLLAMVAATACGTGPVPGDYVFTLQEQGGSCQMDSDILANSPVEDGGMQTIDIGDGEVIFRSNDGNDLVCPLDGNSFDCMAQSESQSGLASTVTVSMSMAGGWTSDTELDLTVHVDLTCQGNGCGLTGALAFGPDFAFPCDTSWTFSGVLAE